MLRLPILLSSVYHCILKTHSSCSSLAQKLPRGRWHNNIQPLVQILTVGGPAQLPSHAQPASGILLLIAAGAPGERSLSASSPFLVCTPLLGAIGLRRRFWNQSVFLGAWTGPYFLCFPDMGSPRVGVPISQGLQTSRFLFVLLGGLCVPVLGVSVTHTPT